MTSLHKRFESPIISTSMGYLHFPVSLGSLVLKEGRALSLDMGNGSSCGIADDVYAFFGDKNGVWYVTYQDYFNGNPWVYCVLFNDVRFAIKGVVNDNGSFLFIEDGKVMEIDKAGKITFVCSTSAIGGLLEYDNDNMPLTLTRIDKYISSVNDFSECEEDVYGDMISIHRTVDKIADKNNIESISRIALAEAVIKTLTLANRAGINIQAEIIKQLKWSLKSKRGKGFGRHFL